MQTIWLSPNGYVSGDPTVQISYPFISHPGTVVTCTSAGDYKWVSIGLPLPADIEIDEIIIGYDVSNQQSFISQIRLTEMGTPDHATVLYDQSMAPPLNSGPAFFTSSVGGKAPTAGCAVSLALRLNFKNTTDEISLGAIGVTVRITRQHCVNSIAALRSLQGGVDPCLEVLGYYFPADGGGGNFYWDPVATGPDDAGTVIVPKSNPPIGRWRRLVGNPWSVRWFGAKGDGTGDDWGAIQAAVNAVLAVAPVNGGTIFVPPGTYVISKAITLGSGVTFAGTGPFTSVIRSISPCDDFIRVTTAQFVTIRDLQLESLIPRGSGAGIRFDAVSLYTIDNVRFIDCYDAATFIDSQQGFISHIRLVSGGASTHRGLFFQKCISIHLCEILMNGGTDTLSSDNAWIQIDSGCDTLIVLNAEAVASSGAGRCLYLSHSLSPASFAPRWVKVTNFLFEGSSDTASSKHQGQDAIEVDDCLSFYLCNGYTATSAIGLVLSGGKDVRASECEFIRSDRHGVYIDGASGVTFTSCIFSDNSQEQDNEYSGAAITAASQYVTFEDCDFGDQVLGSATSITKPRRQKYAIFNDSESTLATGVTTQHLGTGDFGGAKPVRMNRRGDLTWSMDMAPPVSGMYSVGDIVWNGQPSPGGNIGWVCVAVGPPVAWRPFGSISL